MEQMFAFRQYTWYNKSIKQLAGGGAAPMEKLTAMQ